MTAQEQVIHDSAEQLRGSETGKQALEDLHSFLTNKGCSLDQSNQRAVINLLIHAWAGKMGTVLEEIRP